MWLSQLSANNVIWVLEVVVVEWTGIDICHDGGYRRATTTRASRSLLVVLTHRWNVAKRHCGKGADVDADFHRCRAGENIHGLLIIGRIDVLEPHLIFLGGGPALILTIFMG